VPGPGTVVSDLDDPEAAGIRFLAVDRQAHGRGVGRALVQACIALAGAEGRHRIVLHTLATMTTAQGLYRSLGFERDESLDRWWGEVHGLAFRLELPERPR
jgi:ribosomal protein S18 acetylase RimI-like enzyme